MSIALIIVASAAINSLSEDSEGAVNDTFVVDGLTYTVLTDDDTHTAELTKVNDASVVPANLVIGTVTTTDSTVYTVTSIASQAFYNLSVLSSVTIEDSVTSIGSSAFYGSAISILVIKGDCQTTIGTNAFRGCTSLTIADLSGASTIGENAFRGCTSLTSANLSGVTDVGNYAFRDCNALATAVDLSNATSIGYYAFYNCSCMPGVVFNPNGTTVGYMAFQNTAVVSIDLSGVVMTYYDSWYGTTESYDVFAGCKSLTTVTFDASTVFGTSTFYNCSALESVQGVDGAVITELTSSMFYGCSALTLDNISLSSDITELPSGVFSGTATTSVDFTKSPLANVTSVGSKAFQNCASLETVVLSNGMTIGESAFQNCTSLSAISLVSGEFTIGKNAFSGTTIQALDLSGVTLDGDYSFGGCTSLETVAYNSSTTFKGTYTFYGCTSLTSVSSESNDTIALVEGMFQNCSLITFDAINVASDLAEVPAYAFAGTAVDVVDFTTYPLANVTSIGAGAFKDTAVVSVDLSGMTVGGSAFEGCTSLTTVTYDADTTFGGSYTFSGCTSLSSVTSEDGGVITLAEGMFQNCESLNIEDLDISSDITEIPAYVFAGTVVEAVDLTSTPFANVTSIGAGAFQNCEYLTTVNLGQVTILNNYVFQNCTSLRTLTGLENVTSFGQYCLQGAYLANQSIVITSSTTVSGYGLYGLTIGTLTIEDGFSMANNQYAYFGKMTIDTLNFNGCSYSCRYSVVGQFTSANNRSYLPFYSTTIDTLNIGADVPRGMFSECTISTINVTAEDVEISSFVFNLGTISSMTLNDKVALSDNAFFGCEIGSLTIESDDSISLISDSGSEGLDLGSIFLSYVNSAYNYPSSIASVTLVSGGTVSIAASAFDSYLSSSLENLCIRGTDIAITGGAIDGASDLESITIIGGSLVLDSAMYTNSASPTVYLVVDSGIEASNVSTLLPYSQLYVSSALAANGGWDAVEVEGYVYYDETYGILESLSAEYYNVYVVSDIDGLQIAVQDSADGQLTFTVTTSDLHTSGDLAVWLDEGTALVADDSGAYTIESLDGTVLIHIDEAEDSDTWYAVSFDTLSSLDVPSVKISSGHSILSYQLPEPERSGFVFDGWYYSDDYSVEYKGSDDATSGIITGDVTLYAKWTSLGDYLDVDTSAGLFYVVTDGTAGDAFEPTTVASGTSYTLVFIPRNGYTLDSFDVSGTASWSIDGDTVAISNISGYVLVTPSVTYVSGSTDLEFVVEQDTPSADDSLVLIWSFGNGGSTAASWSGMPSTPLVVDDCVYIQMNGYLYRLNADTGEILASVDTGVTSSDYYHYLGYADGYILDYISMKVYLAGFENGDEAVAAIPAGISYTVSFDGYLFGITDSGLLYRMDPSVVDDYGCMSYTVIAVTDTDGNDVSAVSSVYVYEYGALSSTALEDGVLYYLSSSGDDRIVNAIDLSTAGNGTCVYTSKTISEIEKYYWDDGWLTLYTAEDGNTYLYLTAYTTGLFGDSCGVDGNAVIVWMSADGTSFGSTHTVELENSSIASAFVIQNDRGYVNVNESASSGLLQVFNIGTDGTPTLDVTVASGGTHGSIVVSTYDYEYGGGDSVYIYLLNYTTGVGLYVFTDTCTDEGWAMQDGYSSYAITNQYTSQAVRAGTGGQLIFYDDSGTVYCYASSSFASTFRLLVDDGGSMYAVSGDATASDPYEAFMEAAADAFGVRSVAFDQNAGTLTVYGQTYYVYYYGDGGIFKSVAGLTSSEFSTVRAFLLTATASENDIDPDEPWYDVSGTDEGIETSGGLTISDVRLEMTTDGVHGGLSSYTLTLTNTTEQTAVWSSSDSNVVYVDQNGNVTARSLGQATVTASVTVDGALHTVSCVVYVTETTTLDMYQGIRYVQNTAVSAPRYEIVIEDGEYDGASGTYVDATYYVDLNGTIALPSHQPTRDGYEFVGWTDGSAVYESGSTYTVGGAAILKAAWNELDTLVESITLSGTTATLEVSESVALTATVSPENATDASVVWTSSNIGVATVDEDGVVTAVGAGTAVITATAADGSGASATCTVTVERISVTSIALSSEELTIEYGSSSTLTATVSPSNATDRTVVWTSSDTSVVKVSNGRITTVGTGTAVITATTADGGLTATCTVTVVKTSSDGSGTTTEHEETEVGDSTVEKVTETTTAADGTVSTVTTYTVSTEGSTITTTVTVESDGTVTADVDVSASVSGGVGTVSSESMAVVIEQLAAAAEVSGEDVSTVTVNVSGRTGMTGVNVTVSSDSMSGLAGTGLTFSSSIGDVYLSADVTASISGRGDATVSIATVSDTPSALDGMTGVSVYDISLTIGGSPVHDLGGTATVTLFYALPNGWASENVKVYHVADDGSMDLMKSLHDFKTGTVTFETDHFSTFAIVYDESTGVVDTVDEGDSTLMYVAIVIVVIVVIAAVAALFMRGRAGKA